MRQRRTRLLKLAGIAASCAAALAIAPGAAFADDPVPPPDPPLTCDDQTVAVDANRTEPVVITLTCNGPVDVIDFAAVPDPVPDPAPHPTPAHGTVDLPQDPVAAPSAPTVAYTPDAGNPVVDDSFTFIAKSGTGTAEQTSDPATVTLQVAPVCAATAITTLQRTPSAVTLSCTGTLDHITVTNLPTYGTLTQDDRTTPIPKEPGAPNDVTPLHPDTTSTSATVIFWPAYAFSGTDQLTFTAFNGESESEPVVATLTVQPLPSYTGGGGSSLDPPFEFSDGAPIPNGPDAISAPSVPPPAFGPFASSTVRHNDNIPRFGHRARVTMAKHGIRARRSGLVRLKLRNANTFAVHGHLVVHPIGKGKHKARKLRTKPHKVTLPARKVATVSLRLARKQRPVLSRVRRVKMRLVLTARDGSAAKRTIRRTFILRAPAKHHKHRKHHAHR